MEDLLRMLTTLCFSVVCVLYLNYVSITDKGLVRGSASEARTKFNLTDKTEFELREDVLYRQHVFMENYRPIRNSAGIDCIKIVNKDHKEITKSKQFTIKSSNISLDYYLKITDNCHLFHASRGYIDHPLSKMEYAFPMAFSILVYRDIEQVERLLRLIYRPHNFYCIHLDNKMKTAEKETFQKIANCLNNVFIVKEPVNVAWGEFSLLEAELLCMRTLEPYKQWKYYINLTGQEFPLKTNRQLVAILKSIDGANVVYGSLKSASRKKSEAARLWYIARKSEVVEKTGICYLKTSVNFCFGLSLYGSVKSGLSSLDICSISCASELLKRCVKVSTWSCPEVNTSACSQGLHLVRNQKPYDFGTSLGSPK